VKIKLKIIGDFFGMVKHQLDGGGANIKTFPQRGWTIEKNILKVLASDGSESSNGGDIITIKKFSNFELELDFKISKGANSGIK
jgi:hypothetical protein